MNSRSTWFWIFVAAGLLAFITVHKRFRHLPVSGPGKLLPRLKASSVSSIRIRPNGQAEIRAVRTNGLWQLVEPVTYPAQVVSVENLLATLERLSPAAYISAQERRHRLKADEEDGLAPPQATILLDQGEYQPQIWIGAKTAPGDQVFLQVIGGGAPDEGVFVVDADLLRALPRNADDWRDTSFVNLKGLLVDHISVTNGAKVLELQQSAGDRLWRITFPPIQARADNVTVTALLVKLQGLRVNQFLPEDSKTDLEVLGLQPPDLQIGLARGSNTLALLQFGRSPTNDANQVYARRLGQNPLVTVSKDLLAPWRGSVNDFRDRQLLALSNSVEALEIHAEDNFTVQYQTNDHSWRVLPQNFSADPSLVKDLLSNLNAMQIADYFKDVVTPMDLPTYGLAPPLRRYIVKSAAPSPGGLTNELNFGTNQDNKVFARRTDENFLYTIKLEDFQRLPARSVQLRAHQIWNYSEDNLVGASIRQSGKSRQLLHQGPHEWRLAPGLPGSINDLAVAETLRMLAKLDTKDWVARGDQERARFGFNDSSLQVTLELKSGEKATVALGGPTPSHSVYGAVALEGDSWIFEFPLSLYPYVATYLSIP
jgi:Domain of unknown function (DUF4340)